MCSRARVWNRSNSRDFPSRWWRGGSWGNAWPKAVSPPSIRVGRQNELQRLYGLWRQAKGGKGQVALLCGEAGIGKSRISKTLLDRIADDPHVTIRLQCSPYRTNTPFYPIIAQHEHAAHLRRLDPPEVKLEKLEALLSQIGSEIAADAPLYAALLSIPTHGRYPALDLTPRRQKDLTIEALTRQVQTLEIGRASCR